MTTLIGSSTNLLVADVAGREGYIINFFDFTVPGVILAAVGALYIIFVMPLILKKRPGMADEIKANSGRQFVSQIEITPDSSPSRNEIATRPFSATGQHDGPDGGAAGNSHSAPL